MRSAQPYHACRRAPPAQGDKGVRTDQALAHALDGTTCDISLYAVWDLSLAVAWDLSLSDERVRQGQVPDVVQADVAGDAVQRMRQRLVVASELVALRARQAQMCSAAPCWRGGCE